MGILDHHRRVLNRGKVGQDDPVAKYRPGVFKLVEDLPGQRRRIWRLCAAGPSVI